MSTSSSILSDLDTTTESSIMEAISDRMGSSDGKKMSKASREELESQHKSAALLKKYINHGYLDPNKRSKSLPSKSNPRSDSYRNSNRWGVEAGYLSDCDFDSTDLYYGDTSLHQKGISSVLYQDRGIIRENTEDGNLKLILRGVVCKNYPEKYYRNYSHRCSCKYVDSNTYFNSSVVSESGLRHSNYIDYSDDTSSGDNSSESLDTKFFLEAHSGKKPRLQKNVESKYHKCDSLLRKDYQSPNDEMPRNKSRCDRLFHNESPRSGSLHSEESHSDLLQSASSSSESPHNDLLQSASSSSESPHNDFSRGNSTHNDFSRDNSTRIKSETGSPRQKNVSTEALFLSLWAHIVHRSANRASKMMQNFRSTKMNNISKIAQMCAKEGRRIKQPQVKISAKLKKITREVVLFWKRNEKEVRELKKIAKKDALEQKRREQELIEAKRQARKLDFLLTQSELYSHFAAKKLGALRDSPEKPSSKPDRDMNINLDSDQDDLNSNVNRFENDMEVDFFSEEDDKLHERAKNVTKRALMRCINATKEFDRVAQNKKLILAREEQQTKNFAVDPCTVNQMDFMNPSSLKTDSHFEVPKMITASLKAYQVKGLNWLASLFEQGINGILADEMGLGKTLQSIALLAHLAEKYDIWGPFLVVTPTSTLHNWQQEIARFAPKLRVAPYWGDQKDRAILRKYWASNKLYTKDAPFHIVVTSYQIVVIDEQYFKRIKWQYMILDEAQAIKSSDSNRWKILLGVDCRNRLLLTGTPIQNSMQELWALLHFIMPTLFDSHGEFSSWFSRDIEYHAEDKGSLDNHQLRKLHMVLKPFMLRRVKKDVENELSEKIEIELRCQLSVKQRRLYQLLKERLNSSDILEKMSSMTDKQLTETTVGDNIMNLVMQFRKVCNHPGLFEKAHVYSPFLFVAPDHCFTTTDRTPCYYIPYITRSGLRYNVPKLLFESGLIERVGQDNDWAGFISFVRNRMFNILSTDYVLKSVHESKCSNSLYSFSPFVGLSAGEISHITRAPSPFENILFWILKGEDDRRIQVYYRENGFQQPKSPMLKIVKSHTQLPIFGDLLASSGGVCGSNNPPPHVSLGNMFINEYFHSVLRRLPPAYIPGAYAPAPDIVCSSSNFPSWLRNNFSFPITGRACLTGVSCSRIPADRRGDLFIEWIKRQKAPWWVDIAAPIEVSYNPSVFGYDKTSGLLGDSDKNQGHYRFSIPSGSRLISDSGKMCILDKILPELKNGGHRVLIFFQMTKMIDIMEEYLTLRQHSYVRLDGSTTISDRREIVMNWQSRPDLFIFLLSTRAGGVGINLTAADTVIFYDNDWNPTVDQQAMDRCHRLGQKKQVTIYRLITADTIEERILNRAKQKDKIQRVVISGGEFKQQSELNHKEIYNLLLEEGTNAID